MTLIVIENESDHELAFRLQMEEAIAASLSLHRTPTTNDRLRGNVVVSSSGNHDATLLEIEALGTREEEEAAGVSARGFHDRAAGWGSSARESNSEELYGQCSSQRVSIYGESSVSGESRSRIDDRPCARDWSDGASKRVRLSGEIDGGCSRGSGCVSFKRYVLYRLYFKGLVSQERVEGSENVLLGIGTAICDQSDNLLWERKSQLFKENCGQHEAEIISLLISLQDVVELGINCITIFCDYYPVYQFLTQRWTPRQRHHISLMVQVWRLTEKLAISQAILLPRNDVKFAFKLAREAISTSISQHPSPSSENIGDASLKETCVICLEDTDSKQIFSVDKCSHSYCFSCMRQYVEVKLRQGLVPLCPHEGCKSDLHVDTCGKFLTPKFIEIWKQRTKEASIPVTQKVYCPYPRCSALMSKAEASEYSRSVFGDTSSGVTKCIRCHSLFCITCKVPWHSNMSCSDYKRLNPNPPGVDEKLTSLAEHNLWRRCVKCQHMIELSEGCFHMTCRCGYEFCYNCGAEWKNKAATCSCPLWEEHFIWHEDEDDFGEPEHFDGED